MEIYNDSALLSSLYGLLILNVPLLMIFWQNCFRFQHIFLIFKNTFNIPLKRLTMRNDIG